MEGIPCKNIKIIPRVRIGYEMVDSQEGTQGRVWL